MASQELEQLVHALKTAVATLRAAEVPFLLGGSFAAWARGGPPPHKDLDLMVRETDVDRALDALAGAGMRIERPPEEWLAKAYCGEVMIDVIFRPSGVELDDATFGRADALSVMAVTTPVMAIDDVLVTKLSALDEHALDLTSLLGITRALREQIDWRALEARTARSPYARAFFTLVRELGVAPGGTEAAGGSRTPRVRVLPAAERG